MLINWSSGFSQSCRLLNLERFTYFEHIAQSFVDTCPFGGCSLIHIRPHNKPKHVKVNKNCTLSIQRDKQPHFLVIQCERILMINVQATDMADLDVFINILHSQKQTLQFVRSTSIIIGFYKKRVKQTLRKCIALQIWWDTNIQYDLAKYFNYTHKSQ